MQQHVVDDLLLGHAARGHRVGNLLLDKRRPDIAWADRVAGNPERGGFESHRLGQTGDAMLGCDIGGFKRRSDQGMGGGGVDDPTPFARLHPRQSRVNRVERRREIDRNDGLPLFRRKILDWRNELNPGVIDEKVDGAEGFFRLLDHTGDFGALGHVRGGI